MRIYSGVGPILRQEFKLIFNGRLVTNKQKSALDTIITYVTQVADALQYAHQEKLIHRDVKPEQALAAQGQKPIPTTTTTVSPPPTYPAGLTAREVEVLRLLAGGLTDHQIAAKLVLSPRTVHAHISSIYSQLGVTSRSAATRYAIEHHLA